MPLLTRRKILLTHTETVYGSDIGPSESASGDPVLMIDPFEYEQTVDMVEVLGGNIGRGRIRPIAGIRRNGVTFRTYVCGLTTGTYTATVKPPISELLRACGLFETFVTSNAAGVPQYTYTPGGGVGSDTSLSMVAHQDGIDQRLVGARGNVNFIFEAAKPVIAEFNFRGILTTEAATTRGQPVGFSTAIPPRWIDSGSIIAGSYGIPVENLNLNTNNTVYEEPASVARSSSGIYAVIITERNPGGSLDPEATLPSTLDFFAAWKSTSATVLRLAAGVTQGNRFTLTGSRFTYKEVAWGDKEGLSIFNTNFELYENTGNDNFQIIFD